jgi:hypothetical protein
MTFESVVDKVLAYRPAKKKQAGKKVTKKPVLK